MISRRKLLRSSLAAMVTVPSSLKMRAADESPTRLFIGTGNSGPGEGILTANWSSRTGQISNISLAAEVVNPSFLAQFRRPGRETLIYAVSEASSRAASKVSALTAVAGKRELRLLNEVDSQGAGPTHLSVSPDGRTVLVANYGGGSVSSFLVQPNGALSDAISHFQFTGSGPYKGRQEAPHTHSAVPSPDGRFALVNDLGLDRIMIYHLDSTTARLTPADPPFWSGRPGSGPRHLAWSPDGRFVYCSNELDSTVDILAWSEHPLSLRSSGHVSSLPAGFPPNTAFVGEIIASGDGRNAYAGNRVANDTIAVFAVDTSSGLLKPTQFASSGGKNSRHIALDPSGQWMVVSHQNSNDLTVLRRDRSTGSLSEPLHIYPVKKPMCVLFG